MTWFLFAISAPLLWSIVNFADKYLINNFFKNTEKGIGSIMIYSTFFSLFILPIVFILNKEVIINSSAIEIHTLIFSGILNAMAIFFYIFALNEDETSTVIPFFQMIPVFTLFFGYILLKEQITQMQLIASVLIIGGAVFLSTEKTENGSITFKQKAIMYSFISSFLFAGYNTLFKFGTIIEGNFWNAIFWEHVGLFIFGLLLFIFKKSYRLDFISSLKESGKGIVALNISSELLTATGNALAAYATILTSLALANVIINGFQPIFAFILGILITIFFPNIIKENITKNILVKKIIAIIIIFIGTILI